MKFSDLEKGKFYTSHFKYGYKSVKIIFLYGGEMYEKRPFLNMNGEFSFNTCCTAESIVFEDSTIDEIEQLKYEMIKNGYGNLIEIENYQIY